MKKNKSAENITALNAPTQFLEIPGKKIAYRVIGHGKPFLLCNRFRGILDTWDPAFIDRLARKYQVILFDYPGIGRSTGTLPPDVFEVANEVKVFAEAMNLPQFILGGWSYGGAVAQVFAAGYPEMVSQLVLIGTNPPGKNAVPLEQVFLDSALKPDYDLKDEEILFFEPAWPASVQAAKESHDRIAQRKKDLDIPVPVTVFENYAKGLAPFREDVANTREKLLTTPIPILVLMGDHDPSFDVENWFPLVKKSETMQLIIWPRTGHGPQHEHVKLCVSYIHAFIKATGK